MKKKEFIAKVQSDLQLKTRHTKTSIEKLALTYGITDKNTVKEFTEFAIVLEARRLAHQMKPVEARFYDIVELYDSQVNLSHRTSQSMLLQQYSTPAPIGFLGGIFCGFNNSGSYFEPSAGNGLLTIAGDQKNFIVNEIDDTRRENLEDQGYKLVTGKDATQPFNQYKHTFDAIISNPPFGVIDPEVEFDGVSFGVLDHVMCIQALNTMKDSGRAALIIGGHTTWDDKGRIQAGKNRTFFSYLYKHYNVLDVINIDGHALYSKQGTAFNVRLILIDGRKNNPGGFPPLQDKNVNPVVFSYSELYDRVSKYFLADTDKNVFTSDMELEAEALQLELELLNKSVFLGIRNMSNIDDFALKLKDFIQNKGYYVSGVSYSKTQFGNSNYLNVYNSDSTEDYSYPVKIRISDHGVTNFDRIFNETHISFPFYKNGEQFKDSDFEWLIRELDFKLRREMYFDKSEMVELEPYNLEVNDKGLLDSDKIISERLSTGRRGPIRKVYRVERVKKVKYTVFTDKRTNKVYTRIKN